MKFGFAMLPIVVLVSTNAIAGQFDSMMLANALGSVLAAEEPCGLKYNQSAIQAFIAKKVRDDDMGFTSQLNMQTMGSKVMIGEMTESQKTAHCAQTTRVAKKYGFID